MHSASARTCEGENSGLGGASADRVYAFSPPQLAATPSRSRQLDAVVYVASDCRNVSGSCLAAADEAFIGNAEEITLVSEEPPTYIIIDGYSGFSNITKLQSGDRQVRQTRCTPDCAGKSCGDDGCGGQCGACIVPGDICDPTDPATVQGPVILLEPFARSPTFKASGSTVNATNLYAYSYEECPGTDSGAGDGSNDRIPPRGR